MYDKSILAKSTGASLGVVAVVGMLFLSTGTAFAAPISGIGGFVIEADTITGDDFILYPGAGDAENTSQYPQGIVELNAVTIDNLKLIKRFNLNQYNVADANARLVITAGGGSSNVTSGQLLLKTPELSADKAQFSGLEIDEENANDSQAGLHNVLTLRAPANATEASVTRQVNLTGGSNPALLLEGAQIRATYLATNTITLPDLGLEVQLDTNNNGNYTDPQDYT
ncbi:DUF6230 family protein [Halorientalis brevis]|uniref:DUF6230 family protein n=1 Tax=Halorientalis brevis TaxID=1126241 RepID=A0ABD6CCN5_9EURY|nr:DUF6230 family protein [Halorientalis brevis]